MLDPSHPETNARCTAMTIRPCRTSDSARPALQTAVRNFQRWLFSPLLFRTVRFAGVDEKPTRSVRHTAQSSAPPPPPCASHPQLAAHDALMRPFQALTDSCDEQPFNSLSEHPPPAHSHATRTLHSAPHAHTPPRTRPCPWRVLPDRAEQDSRSEPCLTMDLNICHETPSAHRTAHT